MGPEISSARDLIYLILHESANVFYNHKPIVTHNLNCILKVRFLATPCIPGRGLSRRQEIRDSPWSLKGPPQQTLQC